MNIFMHLSVFLPDSTVHIGFKKRKERKKRRKKTQKYSDFIYMLHIHDSALWKPDIASNTT